MQAREIIDIVYRLVEHGVLKTIDKICSAVKSVFGYLSRRQDIKEKKEAQKKADNAEKQLKDACEKGDVKDLINAAENVGKARKKA